MIKVDDYLRENPNDLKIELHLHLEGFGTRVDVRQLNGMVLICLLTVSSCQGSLYLVIYKTSWIFTIRGKCPSDGTGLLRFDAGLSPKMSEQNVLR